MAAKQRCAECEDRVVALPLPDPTSLITCESCGAGYHKCCIEARLPSKPPFHCHYCRRACLVCQQQDDTRLYTCQRCDRNIHAACVREDVAWEVREELFGESLVILGSPDVSVPEKSAVFCRQCCDWPWDIERVHTLRCAAFSRGKRKQPVLASECDFLVTFSDGLAHPVWVEGSWLLRIDPSKVSALVRPKWDYGGGRHGGMRGGTTGAESRLRSLPDPQWGEWVADLEFNASESTKRCKLVARSWSNTVTLPVEEAEALMNTAIDKQLDSSCALDALMPVQRVAYEKLLERHSAGKHSLLIGDTHSRPRMVALAMITRVWSALLVCRNADIEQWQDLLMSTGIRPIVVASRGRDRESTVHYIQTEAHLPMVVVIGSDLQIPPEILDRPWQLMVVNLPAKALVSHLWPILHLICTCNAAFPRLFVTDSQSINAILNVPRDAQDLCRFFEAPVNSTDNDGESLSILARHTVRICLSRASAEEITSRADGRHLIRCGITKEQWKLYIRLLTVTCASLHLFDYQKLVQAIDQMLLVLAHPGCLTGYQLDNTEVDAFIRQSGKLHRLDAFLRNESLKDGKQAVVASYFEDVLMMLHQYIDFRQYQDKVCVIYGPLLLKEKLPGEFKNVGHLIFFDRPSRTLLHTPSVEIGVDVWNFFPGHSVEVIVLQCMHSIETVKQRARKQKDHRRTAAEAIWYAARQVDNLIHEHAEYISQHAMPVHLDEEPIPSDPRVHEESLWGCDIDKFLLDGAKQRAPPAVWRGIGEHVTLFDSNGFTEEHWSDDDESVMPVLQMSLAKKDGWVGGLGELGRFLSSQAMTE